MNPRDFQKGLVGMKQTRTWLITGCSTGIGRGIAEAVLQKGENAVVTARDKSRVKDFEERYPGKALAVTLDMERPETIAQAVEQAQERFGSVDVLINNAGHGYRAALEEGEPAAVAELFQTNFFGPIELIKLVLPAMREQMVSGGFDILSHLMETYFSEPNQDNVSDDMIEALMKSVIRNLRTAIQNPKDYTARSNLLWDSTLGENRLVKMGKRCDFQCHSMEHQLGAYTNCNHGFGLAVLHPVYYRHIYQQGLPKFVRFAENVWAIPRKGKTDEELALAGIEALADFIQEVGLPTTLKELGVEKAQLKEIANSCGISQGSYKRLTHQEIYQIFQECYT